MRKRHVKKNPEVEAIFISDGEEVPEGWVSIGGARFQDLEIEFVLPKSFVLEQPELANQKAENAREEFLEMLSEQEHI